MKRFLVLLGLMFFVLGTAADAYQVEVVSSETAAKIQGKISDIGFRVLNANGIEKRMTFYYDTSKDINAVTYGRDRQIKFYRGLYNMLSDEAEIAAVLSHEISHGVDSYNGAFRGFFEGWGRLILPPVGKSCEYRADKRAVDYMVNAGYNPVAMIVAMSKCFPQQRYDWLSTHPLTSRRMMTVYEYIYKKYPEYLVNNSYKNNPYYQNFLLTSKSNRAKFQKKIESNSKKSPSYL